LGRQSKMVNLDASILQTKVREYKDILIKEYISSKKLTKKEEAEKREVIEIGLNTLELVLSDFTLKLANEIKTLKIKIGVYATIITSILSLVFSKMFDYVIFN
jgi:heme/copper-type cytochrome/quinol oxidase subunit 3